MNSLILIICLTLGLSYKSVPDTYNNIYSSAVTYNNLCSTPVCDIGLYIYDETKGARIRAGERYESLWTPAADIESFEVYTSLSDYIRGNVFLNIWPDIWESFSDHSNYRIGYCIDFTMDNGKTKVHQNVLTPDDTLVYKDYLELYVYDDLHQKINVWYSHVEPDDYNEDTILTSIKLTTGVQYEMIDDIITLTAFVYNRDMSEFDSDGSYTGSTKVSVNIINTH